MLMIMAFLLAWTLANFLNEVHSASLADSPISKKKKKEKKS